MCSEQNENDSAFPQRKREKRRDEPILRSEKKKVDFEAQDFSLCKNLSSNAKTGEKASPKLEPSLGSCEKLTASTPESKVKKEAFCSFPDLFSQPEKAAAGVASPQKRKTTQDYKVQSLFRDFDFDKADSRFFEFPDPLLQEPQKEKDDWRDLVQGMLNNLLD